MLEQLKKEILQSKEISDLIYSGIVDAIIIGGSRILSLDSPSSDCDIIIYVNSGKVTQQKEWCKLELSSGITSHYKLVSIKSILTELTNEHVVDYSIYYNLLYLAISSIKEEYLVYKSPVTWSLFNTLKVNAKPIILLSLTKLLYYARYTLSSLRPWQRYYKAMYHYLSFSYLITNYGLYNSLDYTENQKHQLLNIKTTKTIPTGFVKLFEESYALNSYICNYTYEPIWKELKKEYE